MSKEERIQQQVAEKLGFRYEDGKLYVDGPTTFVHVDRYGHLGQLYSALIAAETKLESQTVAGPIDWEAEQGSLISAMCYGSTGTQIRDDVIVWLKSFVQRIHSSVPEPGDLRTRVGLFMLKRGVKMGRAVDPADVQDMITEFASHSSVPDTKGLETAMWDLIYSAKVAHESSENDCTRNCCVCDCTLAANVKLAESALTSYRERK